MQATIKCRDDLNAITRYVSWNLDGQGGGSFNRALPDQMDVLSVYQVVLKSRKGGDGDSSDESEDRRLTESRPLTPIPVDRRSPDHDYQNLLRLMEDAVMTRDTNRTTLLVGGLVQHIVSNWQLQFARSVTSKFNCYFMLPFVDDFHRFVRKELQKVYEGGEGDDLTDVFDLSAARRTLQLQREELVNECLANKRLQEKFRQCARLMKNKSDGSEQSSEFSFRPELLLDDDE